MRHPDLIMNCIKTEVNGYGGPLAGMHEQIQIVQTAVGVSSTIALLLAQYRVPLAHSSSTMVEIGELEPALVAEGLGGFAEEETEVGVIGVDAAAEEILGEGGVIGGGVEGEEGQGEAALAAGGAVAGSGVAALAGEHGEYVVAEGDGGMRHIGD